MEILDRVQKQFQDRDGIRVSFSELVRSSVERTYGPPQTPTA